MNTDQVTLGISTTHETGASIFKGGVLKAAVSEERMDRIKFSTKYPPKLSIKEVIRISGIDPKEISEVVISGLPPGKIFWVLLKGQLKDCLDFHSWNDYFPHLCKVLYRAFYMYRAMGYRSINSFFKKEFGIKPKLRYIEHHLCHASAVYRTAPFDNALIVTGDGVGDDISFTVSEGRNGKITRLKEIPYPHSFGQFYTACTQLLGFKANRHEGKITGLSGFGEIKPEILEKVKSTIKRSGPDFALHKKYYSEGIIRGISLKSLIRGEGLFEGLKYRNYKKPLKKLLQGYKREDVAAVFQHLLEVEAEAVVRPYAESTGLKNLALCGGIFANVKLNAHLFRNLNMEKVYIFPHMGDGGLSVGAVLEHQQSMPESFDSVFWGSEFTDAEIESALVAQEKNGLSFERKENIEKDVADLLVKNKVVARFNGRMEFGPRALCNRSILYSAADKETNNWLNKKLGRTEFMPFAPVVLTEKANDMFVDIEGTEHACKFMTIILDCTDFTKKNCPAVVHVDGTARPQFVTADINPSMHKILTYYDKLTGVPLLVNTSFNMHEEPIVRSPQDAVRAFQSSTLDYLAIGPFLAWLDK